MSKITDSHMLKAIATLVALSQYKGTKNDFALMHCQWATEELALCAAIDEGLQGAVKSARSEELRTEQWLALLKAAKLLGIFREEPAGPPTDEWIDKVRREGGDSGFDTWWHRFSKN